MVSDGSTQKADAQLRLVVTKRETTTVPALTADTGPGDVDRIQCHSACRRESAHGKEETESEREDTC